MPVLGKKRIGWGKGGEKISLDTPPLNVYIGHMDATRPPTPPGRWLSQESKMKFTKWINPKDGSVRVYVNGAASYGISVFVVDGGASGRYEPNHADIRVIAKDGHRVGQSEIDSIMDRLDKFVDEHRPVQPSPWVCPKFSDYLSLAQ